MPSRKSPRKPAKGRAPATPVVRSPAAAGVVRTLHTARDGLFEFGYFAAACGAMIGMLMLLHRMPIG